MILHFPRVPRASDQNPEFDVQPQRLLGQVGAGDKNLLSISDHAFDVQRASPSGSRARCSLASTRTSAHDSSGSPMAISGL